MIDRATEIAAFLAERDEGSEDPAEIWAEMQRRWPGITREEGCRGAAIAAELLGGGIAEQVAEAGALESILSAHATDDPEARARAAEAVAGWGEAEFRELAEGTGIPLDHIRIALEAIRRGDPLPLANGEREESDRADRDR